MEKYENGNGQIAVLVSRGLGAGWSTWGSDEAFLSMDKTLVEMKLNDAPSSEVSAYCKKIKGEQYMGGWSSVCVEWLDKGTAFTIEEYDGSESLRTSSDLVLTA